MKTEIILVLHALTQWNVEKKGQGHIDTPLNETGRRMAELLAGRLRNVPVTAIYSSDLRRAYETAEPTARIKNLPILKDLRLRENRKKINRTDAEYPNLPFPDPDETTEDCRARMVAAMTDIAENNPGERVLVFSHGAAIREFVQHVLASEGRDPGEYEHCEGRRTAPNKVVYEAGKWHIDFGDVGHLAPIEKESNDGADIHSDSG